MNLSHQPSKADSSMPTGVTAASKTSRRKLQGKQDGIIEIIVVIIIALVLLHVLGIDIRDILSKPWVRDFALFMLGLLKIVWQDILEIVAFFKTLAA